MKLIRVKSYLKNFLILLPFFFSGKFLIFSMDTYKTELIGFLIFCFIASVVYIINDIIDKEKDKNHPLKCKRPLANGTISIKNAIIVIVIFLIICISLLIYLNKLDLYILILIYFILNILYSTKLKNIPIMDISLISIFFLIRIYYGAILCDVDISIWLYLTTLSVAYYLGIGKRRNELKYENNVRDVLKEYPLDYLEQILTVFLGSSILFYSLWIVNGNFAIPMNINYLCISIFLVIVVLLRYHYILYKQKNGNPVDIILKDKHLIFYIFLYGLSIFLAIFF